MTLKFKYVKEEAEYRLMIKKEIKKLGQELIGDMKKLPTENLLEIRDLLLIKRGKIR